MKKILPIVFLMFTICLPAAAQELKDSYEGKLISEINVTTQRIYPSIVRNEFDLKEGDVFAKEKYEKACKDIHDLNVFKSVDFSIVEKEDGTLAINIDGKDSYFVFPFMMATGGASNAAAVMLMEQNLFKLGEFSMLMGFFSDLGYGVMSGFGNREGFISLGFSNMDSTQYYYPPNGSYGEVRNAMAPLPNDFESYTLKENSVRLSVSRPLSELVSVSVGYRIVDVDYGGDFPLADDKGSHNAASISLTMSKDMPQAGGGLSSIGMVFGMGTSKLDDMFAKLDEINVGYLLSAGYDNGNKLFGADYYISKGRLNGGIGLEFRNRSMLIFRTDYQYIFDAPFADLIDSDELTGRGTYLRKFKGIKGVGAELSYVVRIFATKKGFAVFSPFIESATVWDRDTGKSKNMPGAGFGISYMFRSFPIPLGLKYTRNLDDGIYDVTFLFGGSF